MAALDFICYFIFYCCSLYFYPSREIISASFNGFLAEKIQKLETGKDPESSGKSILKDIPIALKRSVRFIFYYLFRAILVLILFFIPLVQVIVAPLWFLLNAWMMTL